MEQDETFEIIEQMNLVTENEEVCENDCKQKVDVDKIYYDFFFAFAEVFLNGAHRSSINS